MPAGTTWTTPEGGFFIWLTLPDGASANATPGCRARAQHRVPARFGLLLSQAGDNKIRLSYSFANEAQIREGIAALGEMIATQLAELMLGATATTKTRKVTQMTSLEQLLTLADEAHRKPWR